MKRMKNIFALALVICMLFTSVFAHDRINGPATEDGSSINFKNSEMQYNAADGKLTVEVAAQRDMTATIITLNVVCDPEKWQITKKIKGEIAATKLAISSDKKMISCTFENDPDEGLELKAGDVLFSFEATPVAGADVNNTTFTMRGITVDYQYIEVGDENGNGTEDEDIMTEYIDYKTGEVWTATVTAAASEKTAKFVIDGTEDTTLAQTVTAGTTITLPVPAKEGYTFSGWSVNGSAVSGTTYVVNDDVTFTGTFTKDAIDNSVVEGAQSYISVTVGEETYSNIWKGIFTTALKGTVKNISLKFDDNDRVLTANSLGKKVEGEGNLTFSYVIVGREIVDTVKAVATVEWE